ncbi:MAG: NAD(P)/FAD-dependent oxidoreductase [Candidatus Margulisiibacteriota bacterium]
MTTDLLIIGGGPAGYTAAIEAANAGAKVRLFEKQWLGGTCLNAGCIPTKCLLEGSGLLQKIKKANYFGIDAPSPSVNFKRMAQRKNIVVSKLGKGLEKELTDGNIDIIRENISLTDAIKQSAKVIIATGTSPRVLPDTISTDDILNIENIPESIKIIGAGAVGLEMATLFCQLGSKVTVAEIADQILPFAAAPEVARELQKILERQGIKFEIGEQVSPLNPPEGGLNTPELTTLSCVGRIYNNAGLAEAGVALGPKGEVVTDDYFQTNLPGVYAAGDITGKFLLAHVAYAQGRAAALNAFSGKETVDYSAVPFCVFTDPVFASVGKTGGAKVLTAPYSQLGTAQAKGNTEGFIRAVLLEDEQTIAGIQIIGPGAAELISTATIIVQKRMTLKDLQKTIFTHPTLGEIFALLIN